MEILLKGYPVEINVLSFYAGRKAKTDALPENCYEEESPSAEWELVDSEDTLLNFLLESDYEEEITELVIESCFEEKRRGYYD